MHYSLFLAVLLAVFSLGHSHGQGFPSIAQDGAPCSVRRPERCGDPLSVSEFVEPADDFFGQNVCRYHKTEIVAVSDYVLRRECSAGRFLCRVSCEKTANCTVQQVNSTYYDCCEGYGARSIGRDHGFGHTGIIQHPGYITLQREGCPIELKTTVVDCLLDLGLTDLINSTKGTSLELLLQEDREFTVFAPTNEVLDGAFLPEFILRAHIVDELVPNYLLRSGAILLPLNRETLLHVTDVHLFRGWWQYSEETFINGAKVNVSDACRAENGIVHTLSAVISFSSDSIMELLDREPQFSILTALLRATNISQYLGPGVNTSRTLFAPTNEAFNSLPQGAVDCLLQPENVKKALWIVLTHITSPVEYTPSLSLRSSIGTFSGYRLLVCVINDTIHLTQNSVPLMDTNIPARNGVIHSVPEVLLANKIDFEKFCPSPPPVIEPTVIPLPPA